MNKKIFVDTSAFLALTNRSDQYHHQAVNELNQLRTIRSKLVTTNFILDETYTRLRNKAGVRVAIAFGEKIQSSGEISIEIINKQVEKAAWDIFKKYEDQRFSYTDCTSFALMKLKKIKDSFSFDQDFTIFGSINHP